MLIITLLLLTKFESANLMSLNDKWTFGTRTLWIDASGVYKHTKEARQRARREYRESGELAYSSNIPYGFQPNAYFISRKLGKTFTLGIQADGDVHRYANNTNVNRYHWNGSVGLSLSKYFRAGNLLSPFITLTPNFSSTHDYDYSAHFYCIYGLNLDAGVEYFFTCWGKNLSLQLETPLVKATRMYEKKNRSSPYCSTDNIYFYSPLEGNLTSYLCLHF